MWFYIDNDQVLDASFDDMRGNTGWVFLQPPESIDVYNLYDEKGAARYKLVDGSFIERSEEERKLNWLEERHMPTATQVAAFASIAFVALAESGSIDAVTAAENASLFAEWVANVAYSAGQYRRYGGRLYRCLQAHTSQAGWEPDAAVSLWKLAADPTEEWPEWSQPIGAMDAYAKGDRVSHNGERWISAIDGNVWEPGVYGWDEVSE